MEQDHRYLIVTADDFGIGPATSEGILDAGEAGAVTASVLLVNSPYAASAVRHWRRMGCPFVLGWHPNLTLDAPILPPARVRSLVRPDGRFLSLGAFMRRWVLGRLRRDQIELELGAQLRRFCDLTGQLPALVNTHQHVAVFSPVGEVLQFVLAQHGCRPYFRRVRESWRTLWHVPGARCKRLFLNMLGRRQAKHQDASDSQGNDWLIGITDPKWVNRPTFFQQWLRSVPGNVVELMCHPGYLDPTLLGRDCIPGDGLLQRRVDELDLLRRPEFLRSVRDAGFTLTAPQQFTPQREAHVLVA